MTINVGRIGSKTKRHEDGLELLSFVEQQVGVGIDVLSPSRQSYAIIVALVPLASHPHEGDVMPTHPTAPVRNHTVELVGLGSEFEGLGVDDAVGQFHQHIVLIGKTLEVKLNGRGGTRRMFG
jgi:hypothetical protein